MPEIELVGEETPTTTPTTSTTQEANPYLKPTTTEPVQESQQQPPPAPAAETFLGGIGLRPLLYGFLFLYLIANSYFRSKPEATAATTNHHPDVNNLHSHQTANEFGEDYDLDHEDDDEFGDFDDKDTSLESPGAAYPTTTTDKYATATTGANKMSLHTIQILFCTGKRKRDFLDSKSCTYITYN